MISPETRVPMSPQIPKQGSELTRAQLWARKVLETGEQSPHILRKPTYTSFIDAAWTLLDSPGDFFRHMDDHILQIDKDLRGGRDLGGIKDRSERVAVFTGILVGSLGLDAAASKRVINYVFAPKEDGKRIASQKGDGNKFAYAWKGSWEDDAAFFEVFGDKFIVNGVNYLLQQYTDTKSNLVPEFSEQIADMLTTIFRDKQIQNITKHKATVDINDFINGTAIEMVFRILSQVPIAGAMVEMPLQKMNAIVETNKITKLTGKAVAIWAGRRIRRVLGKNEAFNKGDWAMLASSLL